MQTRTIGLLGGIGWASTAEYYRLINEMVAAREGPSHSARIVLQSMDQFDFTSRAASDVPDEIINFIVSHVEKLKAGGADFFMFCANGAHRFAPTFLPLVDLPFVSIVDATAERVAASGMRKVGLLGVKQTMAGSFYHDDWRHMASRSSRHPSPSRTPSTISCIANSFKTGSAMKAARSSLRSSMVLLSKAHKVVFLGARKFRY